MKRHFDRTLKMFAAALIIITACALGKGNSATGRDWEPRKTWVFVVGVLRWQDRDMFNSFPQTNRRDEQLVDFFRQQGVPKNQIVFLKDEQATTRRIRNEFSTLLSRAAPGDFLFFYYTGHGYKSDDERTTYFASYDASESTAGWPTDSIVGDVERYFRGSYALLTADTCFSGDLANEMQRFGRRVSYATLTSASANQVSTENWTFTEMLLAGLRGEPFADINGDGEVSLAELAEDIREDMAYAEDQRSIFATTRTFPAQMFLAPAAHKVDPLISRRVEVRSEGDWYKARVIDARGSLYRVHYFGFEDSDDEWVSLRRIRNPRADYATNRTAESDWETGRPINSDSRVWSTNARKDRNNGWDVSVMRNGSHHGSNSNRDSRDWQ